MRGKALAAHFFTYIYKDTPNPDSTHEVYISKPLS
jgi:hypothetical protein